MIFPIISELLDNYITNNIKYFPYFKNYLGVLNDIYLLAYLPSTLISPYCN